MHPGDHVDLLSFADAIEQSSQLSKRHVLLGNGFSIACKPDIFAYGALFEQADFRDGRELTRSAFDVLETRDFEEVMKALRDAAKLLRHLDPRHEAVAAELMQSVHELREILVGTIARQHPDKPSDVPETSYRACRAFLAHFDHIYSFNYDLLLYWALMQSELPPKVSHDDGFRTPEDGPATYVTWEVEHSDSQNVFYLHGALHIFDAGSELQKFTWINTGLRLIDQIRDALERDLFPLIVSEGTSKGKKEKIMHSGYLSRGYRSLPKITGALFIYGHSLAENDEHILRLVQHSKVSELYIGVFGDPKTTANSRIVDRGLRLQAARKGRKVKFFDSTSAKVWG
jgi:hypothetical protein